MSDTILDLDSLLDNSLDAVPDAPDYLTPPPGTYVVKVKEVELQKYKPKDKTEEALRINMTYEIVSTVQLAEGSQPIPDGSLFSERFNHNEQGLGYFKRTAKNFLGVTDLTGASLRDIFSSLKEETGKQVVITNVKDGEYTNIRMRVLEA